jgi:transketolase
VVRPADANETAWAWRLAVSRRDGPVALALTRQNLPTMDRAGLGAAEGVLRGGYVLADPESGSPQAVIIATGSEVPLALAAQRLLQQEKRRVRVVSMPCLEVFAEQPPAYRDQVLPPTLGARLAVEAAHPQSWYRWVGDAGEVMGLERFGASAPAPRLFAEMGFTAERVAERVRALLK